jgi:YD repeat-containing protein
MTFFWKYPGILRRSGVGPWLTLGMALVGACFSGSPVLDWVVSSARADNVSYAYNASGRVIQATDNSSGQAVFYSYDAAGNISSQTIVPLGTLGVSGLSLDQGSTSTQVTIYGTGFSTTAANDVVMINGVAATVISATATQLVVSVPAGAAASGTVSVEVGGSTVNSPTSIAVTTAVAAPTLTAFTPSSGAAGTVVTLTGTNFQGALDDNKVTVNGRPVPVTAASATALTITIPSAVTSGPIQVTTPYGQATSSGNLAVPPPGYSLSSLGSVVQASEDGGSVSVAVGTNQIGLVLFNGNTGDQYVRAAVNTQASVIEVLDPNGRVVASGCSSSCLYNLPTLVVPGMYAVLIADPTVGSTIPVTIATARTGIMDLSWANEGQPAYMWDETVALATSQRQILTFSGTTGQITTINFRSLFNTWTASLWNSSGQTVWSSTVTSGASAVTTSALPANGSYSLVFDPQFLGGSFNYEAGIVPASQLAVNGAAITVDGGGPGNGNGGPVAKATFSGTAGQKVSLTVTATQGFFYGLNIYNQTSSGETCLGSCGSGLSGGTCNILLPTLPVTGTYIVYVQFASNLYSTATISLSTNTNVTGCSGGVG